MRHEESIRKMVREADYLDCWKSTEVPAFEEFYNVLVDRLSSVISDDVNTIHVYIDSNTEGRIHVGGSFVSNGKPYEIFGKIVWVPKNSFFRGKLGAKEIEEPSEAPEDTSASFKRVSDTEHDLNLHGGIVKLKPKSLVKAFGAPDEADGFKVSGIYLFEGNSQTGYRLHDYEETTLYWDKDKYPDVPSPEEFWSSNNLYDFRIAGSSSPNKIIEWIKSQTK